MTRIRRLYDKDQEVINYNPIIEPLQILCWTGWNREVWRLAKTQGSGRKQMYAFLGPAPHKIYHSFQLNKQYYNTTIPQHLFYGVLIFP